MENHEKNGIVNKTSKARLQLALSEIMAGYLLLDEAVQKYEVPASTIIQHLKKIQKQKKAALLANDPKTQGTVPPNASNKDGN